MKPQRSSLRGSSLRITSVAVAVAALLAAGVLPGSASADNSGLTSQQVAEEIVRVQGEADGLADRWNHAQTEADNLAAQLTEAQQQLDAQTARAGQLDADLTRVAVERYTGAADASIISFLVDPTDQLKSDAYRSVAVDTGAADLDQVEAVRTELQHTQDHVHDLQARNDKLAKQISATQDEVAAKLDQLSQLHERLKDEETRRAYEALLAKQRAEEEARQAAAAAAAAAAAKAQADAEAAAARAQQAASPPAVVEAAAEVVVRPGSGFTCPVAGSVAFGDTWGAARSGGRRHQGVDLMASFGTPVVAAVSGTVTMKHDPLGGNAIGLDSDAGDHYYYAHLSRYEGGSRHVSAGEVIGYVGHTGDTSVNHLHFEIHPNGGAAVNPYPTVRQYC